MLVPVEVSPCEPLEGPVRHDSLNFLFCLQSCGQQSALVLSSLMERRMVDFLVCVAFNVLLGSSSDFQALYMHNWKLNLAIF